MIDQSLLEYVPTSVSLLNERNESLLQGDGFLAFVHIKLFQPLRSRMACLPFVPLEVFEESFRLFYFPNLLLRLILLLKRALFFREHFCKIFARSKFSAIFSEFIKTAPILLEYPERFKFDLVCCAMRL